MGSKTKTPKFSTKRGVWLGGDSRTLYTYTARATGAIVVHYGGYPFSFGSEADVRIATKLEAETHWQNPLHSGWKVA